jgi:hypothetical protein
VDPPRRDGRRVDRLVRVPGAAHPDRTLAAAAVGARARPRNATVVFGTTAAVGATAVFIVVAGILPPW